jgi:hypothetical protein
MRMIERERERLRMRKKWKRRIYSEKVMKKKMEF